MTPAASARGIGRYARLLLRGLQRWPPRVEVLFYSRKPLSAEVHHEPMSRWAFHTWGGRRICQRLQVDLFVSLDFVLPLGLSCPAIVVAHDCIPWHHPQFLRFRSRLLYQGFWPESARRAALILCDSQFTLSHLPSSLRMKGRVLYPAIEEQFFLPEGDREPLLVFFGTLDRRRLRDLVLGVCPTVARELGWQFRILGRVEGRRFPQLLQNPSDEEALTHLRRARALLFLSQVEGFGYPAVEGLLAGCSVLVTDIPVFREILGDAAYYWSPPWTPARLAEILRSWLPQAQPVAEERRKALLERFSLRRFAAEWARVLEEACALR